MPQIPVIFEDNDVLILDKPYGLVVTDSETSRDQKTLEQILKNEFNISIDRGGIVHRLDKDTSGIIIVAKNQVSLDSLQLQFKERVIKKKYLALVHGWIKESGVIVGSIGRNPGNREKFTVLDEGEGKEAETEYKPLENLIMEESTREVLFPEFNKIQLRKLNSLNYDKYTLVECHPLTGRTHQIRVHLKHINFPIAGDEKYVGRRLVRLDHRWIKRQFLHAFEIEFKHPSSGESIRFRSELTDDLKASLSNLKLHTKF